MKQESITPLHVRSGYSLLRGTVGLESLTRRAASLGHKRIALTDVNNLYGATRFWQLAKESGLEPILGAELIEDSQSIIALVENDKGYENLCRLITRINRRQAAQNGNVDALTGSRQPAAKLVGDLMELSEGLSLIVADAHLSERLLSGGLIGENLYIGLDPATQKYPKLRRLAETGKRMSLPPVATATAMMGDADQSDIARLLTAIRLGKTFDAVMPAAMPNPRAVLRSEVQLSIELASFTEAKANNCRLAEKCSDFNLLPRRAVFPSFAVPDGKTAKAHLRWLCQKALKLRYADYGDQARTRLGKELALIESKGFSEYFLVVSDIVQYARRRGAPVAGRGSGAGSLVAYLLGITNVCPLAYDIPFERFLNDERDDLPDLDIDLCWRLRDEVIDYAFSRWGRDYVAMVSMHLTFQPRSAIRETAKAMGLSNDQISRLMNNNLEAIVAKSPEHRRKLKVLDGPPEELLRRIGHLSRRLLHLPHNLSVHPGGIVIGHKPIDRYVPIQHSAKGVWITQYDKNGVADIGLVKLDMLGNRGLSTVRYACNLIARRTGRQIDIESLPTDDKATVELLRSARTVGCNQLESPAMRHLLRMMRPSDTRDLMKVLALIRPGAASIGMKETFVRRHRGLETTPPVPAVMASVLDDTQGVMLYEDDVMLTISAMLGCSLAKADRFRRAIQKCHSDAQRLKLSEQFLNKCAANSIDREYAKSMWVQMAKFNAYSFCRAHAASYAMLSYSGAYMKAHWPIEFWAAALNNNQGMYHHRLYLEQAKHDGVSFALPDINRSGKEFEIDSTADGEVIRAGLGLVAGLGPAGVEQIIRVRLKGLFRNLSDFLMRVNLEDEQARSLILCGAFDSLGCTRPAMMMELNLVSRLSRARQSTTLMRTSPVIPSPPGDYSPYRKYFDQRRILGITVGDHLMTLYRPLLRGKVNADSRDVAARTSGCIRLAGFLEARRTTPTRQRRVMTFLTLEDEYGLFEVTVLPGANRKNSGRFVRYGPYIVTGEVENQYDSLSIVAESVEYLDVSADRLREMQDLSTAKASQHRMM